MADELRTIEGRFLMSISDRPEMREMFHWTDIEPVATTYSVQRSATSEAAELLIGKNVELASAAPQASLF